MRYIATARFISPPRDSDPIELGTFEASSGAEAHLKAKELAAEQDAQGTIEVRTA